VTVFGPVPAGLVRYYCNTCRDAPVDTLPNALEVWCPKGHRCKTEPTQRTKDALRDKAKAG